MDVQYIFNSKVNVRFLHALTFIVSFCISCPTTVYMYVHVHLERDRLVEDQI